LLIASIYRDADLAWRESIASLQRFWIPNKFKTLPEAAIKVLPGLTRIPAKYPGAPISAKGVL